MMPQSLANVLTHIIFSTKHRQNLIDADVAPSLYEYLGGACRALDSPAIKVGGYFDHVHILASLSRKIAIMDFLEEIKKRSSKWIKTKDTVYRNFYWQDGYAIFSVNPRQEAAVVHYIENQHLHHLHMGFKDECRMLFRRNRIAWDERYVWD
jgi:REP element-mobilizing transposase RayT